MQPTGFSPVTAESGDYGNSQSVIAATEEVQALQEYSARQAVLSGDNKRADQLMRSYHEAQQTKMDILQTCGSTLGHWVKEAPACLPA